MRDTKRERERKKSTKHNNNNKKKNEKKQTKKKNRFSFIHLFLRIGKPYPPLFTSIFNEKYNRELAISM